MPFREPAGNNLVNFALLKTIGLKDPVRSGQQMAVHLGRLANEIGGGRPLMQRVGDFRMGKRSTAETFNEDLYAFPQLPGHRRRLTRRAGQDHAPHLGGAEEARHHRPRRPPPSTIMYYPEIKMYANKPVFLDRHFRVSGNVFMVGDGAGTRAHHRRLASGIRAAEGILGGN